MNSLPPYSLSACLRQLFTSRLTDIFYIQSQGSTDKNFDRTWQVSNKTSRTNSDRSVPSPENPILDSGPEKCASW